MPSLDDSPLEDLQMMRKKSQDLPFPSESRNGKALERIQTSNNGRFKGDSII